MGNERSEKRPPWVLVNKGPNKVEVPIAEALSEKGVPVLVRDYDSGKKGDYNSVLIFQTFEARTQFNQVRQHARLKEALREITTNDEELLSVIKSLIDEQLPTP